MNDLRTCNYGNATIAIVLLTGGDRLQRVITKAKQHLVQEA